MNERFLSKAKRMDNGEWVEGQYLRCIDSDLSDIFDWIIIQEEIHKENVFDYKINPSTLCQCTGIPSDDEGKPMVFESDKVLLIASGLESHFGNEFEGVVIPLEGGWYVDNGKGRAFQLWQECGYIRILGNIHEKESD